MRFISPKTDFAFKKIFGSDKSKDILISFLNATIYSGKEEIQDLEIIDPYNPGDVIDLKDSYLDVKAVLKDKTTVIIEMQLWNVEAFKKRVVYNLCKTYGNQLKLGQGYFDLNPVIALTITDFKLFSCSEKVINCFYFQEAEKHFAYQKDELKLVFVELPKFKKKLEELETAVDKWIYFLKEAPSLEIIPDKMKEIPQLEKALNIADRASLSVEELEKLRKEEMSLEDKRGALSLAKRKAKEEGREEGRKEGLQEGLQEGREEGLIEGRIEGEKSLILRQLQRRFGELTTEAIALIEALSSQQLEALGEEMWDFNTSEDLHNWLASTS